jgi:hypothetical protein
MRAIGSFGNFWALYSCAGAVAELVGIEGGVVSG